MVEILKVQSLDFL